LREIAIVDTVFDEINNCAYLILRDADEHFQLQVTKDIGKKVALLLYNAFPSDEKSIYSSFVKLVNEFGFQIISVILLPNLKSGDLARIVISNGEQTIELFIDSEDAILVALISSAVIFIDYDEEREEKEDIEKTLLSNWYNFFSKVL